LTITSTNGTLVDVSDSTRIRVAVVGSGFSGLGLGHGLKRAGIDDFVLLERGDDVGGTWRDNTYPGCQCDVPSHLYSFSFAPNPDWSRTYSTQPEIQAYLRRCADDLGLRRHLRTNCEVQGAVWEEDSATWLVDTSQGTFRADVLVSAHGGLSEPSMPDLPGLEDFAGTVFHSAQWDHDHDLTGERVAVIGTGASAIQIIPKIQPAVGCLTVLQRTPAWVLPHTDRPVTRFEKHLYRRVPALQRVVRNLIYLSRELVVVALAKHTRLTRGMRRLGLVNLHKHVKDPDLREKLTPQFDPGCKRLLLSDTYYPALTQPNVEVVTSGIERVTPTGVRTTDGVDHEVDTIIAATGFRVTDNPIAARVKGRDGETLADAWQNTGPRAYLGTTVPGFPNLFLMTGPNTGIGHTSLVYMIESQVPYVLGALDVLDRPGVAALDVRADVADRFDEDLQRAMTKTVWNAGGCQSWYLHESGRNATLWPDFTFRYRRRTARFDVENYELVGRPS
jgi:cation diffusion facilitator CzcD-associated flavoprotein CzcO